MTEAQLENPAQLGRRERIKSLRMYLESNRQSKRLGVMLSEFCLENGITTKMVNSYMNLFYSAGIYEEPVWWIPGDMLDTPSERVPKVEAYERQQAIDKAEREKKGYSRY